MKSIKLLALSGIRGKIRGFKERGKLRLEISWGLKCNKQKIGVKPASQQSTFLLPFLVMGWPRVAWGRSYTVWRSLEAKP